MHTGDHGNERESVGPQSTALPEYLPQNVHKSCLVGKFEDKYILIKTSHVKVPASYVVIVIIMSLRYMSRVMYQAGVRVVQGMKDQRSKCDYSTLKSLKDSACSPSSKQARRFSSSSFNSSAIKSSDSHKIKQAEESLRTVMYLSCWGPN
ncbi:hypothetical protein Ahy_B10g100948 isoform A [Arachis hypogaea]|uniref:Uncharacterized protein n=1 Tax=Arachis hypogaea TaxID=3818 RepID=A0A444WYC9_ARAHY|nr:hypothetical protein Ahy_B10g100948 isoform A [Arachis hypogaea]